MTVQISKFLQEEGEPIGWHCGDKCRCNRELCVVSCTVSCENYCEYVSVERVLNNYHLICIILWWFSLKLSLILISIFSCVNCLPWHCQSMSKALFDVSSAEVYHTTQCPFVFITNSQFWWIYAGNILKLCQILFHDKWQCVMMLIMMVSSEWTAHAWLAALLIKYMEHVYYYLG